MTQLNWGVLGTAGIAKHWLCPALHASPRGRFAGIASRSLASAEAFAAPYQNVKAYGEYDALLADPSIDAIYIPLPNTDHVSWTLKCLAAGKHVLCEKPIAMQADEIDQLIAVRDRTGLLAAEAFMVTHHPQWHRVREWINAGKIGKLKHVQGAFSYYNDDPTNIRNQPEFGGGALPDIGVYPSVTTRFVTGEEPLRARSTIEWHNGVDTTARVQADFPGFGLDFYVSMRMGPQQEMVFHGETGFITVSAPFNPHSFGPAVIELRQANGERHTESFEPVSHYTLQFDAFHNTVLDGTPFACPLEFSKQNQAMIDMIYAGEMKV